MADQVIDPPPLIDPEEKGQLVLVCEDGRRFLITITSMREDPKTGKTAVDYDIIKELSREQ